MKWTLLIALVVAASLLVPLFHYHTLDPCQILRQELLHEAERVGDNPMGVRRFWRLAAPQLGPGDCIGGLWRLKTKGVIIDD